MELREEVGDPLNCLVGADSDPREAYPAIDRTFAEGWDDPMMRDYDRYEELRKQGNIPLCVN